MREQAFTLIEIMVVIGVMTTLFGMSFAGYTRFSQRQSLIGVGKTMKNILRDAQSRAYTGEVDCSVCSCTPTNISTVTGWYVDFTSRTIYGRCGTTTPTPFFSKSLDIPSDIRITPHISPPTLLQFSRFPLGVSPPGILCLSDPDFPGFYRIVVGSSGEISDTGSVSISCP